MPVPHATETPDRIEHRTPGRQSESRTTGAPSRARRPRLSDRRLLVVALVLAGAVHLLLLWALRLPSPGSVRPVREVNVILEPVLPTRPEAGPAPEPPVGPAEEPFREPGPRAAPRARPLETPIARPRPSGRAPELRTIPPTTLLSPLTPLEATPGGIGRRTAPIDARRSEIQRAESLLASRLADLPGAGVPREPAVGLAEGGGVTVPVPWGGFVPEDRKDRVWREERCAGKDADDADKPGEAEARASQCD